MQGPAQLDEVEEADYVQINADDATSNTATPLSITKSSSNSTLELNQTDENLDTRLLELSMAEKKDEFAIQSGPEENLQPKLADLSPVQNKDEVAIQAVPEESSSEEEDDEEILEPAEFFGLNILKNACKGILEDIKNVATEIRNYYSEKAEHDVAHGVTHLITGAALELAVEKMESSSKADTFKRQAEEAILDLTGKTFINAGVKELYRVETDVKIAAAAEATRETAVILQKATGAGILTSFKSSSKNQNPVLEPQAAPKSGKKNKGKKLK